MPDASEPCDDAVTARAAGLLARCFAELVARGVPRHAAQRCTLDALAALFAGRPLDPQIDRSATEAALLADAAACDWSRVRPEIFGDLFERSLPAGERHRTGSHFTSPADILKIVGPTIVAPWSALIDQARTPDQLRALHARMCRYKVLDPACGSGNFLRVAFRELKRLEATLINKMSEEPAERITAAQLFGIDISPLAVELAILTMQLGAPPLDLAPNFKIMDAIVAPDGSIPAWEPVDVIIGNPPFLDARKLTVEHGRDYVARLRAAYPDIPGRADYCVYWFRRAHDHAPAFAERDPVAGRIGLVGTHTIRHNNSRAGGLDRIVADRGTIVDAVASQVWSGTAAVHVSIVNWVKGDYRGPRILHEQLGDQRDSAWRSDVVPTITSALTSRQDASGAAEIQAVTRHKRCFEGQQPGHTGFRIDLDTYRDLAKRDPKVDDVVFQYMIGDSLLSGIYREAPEFVIDFGERSIIEAAKHPHVLDVIKRNVLPKWRDNADKEGEELGSEGEHQRRLQVWWRLKRRRAEMLDAIAKLSRYIACVRHTKRPIFEFLHKDIRPDSALTVFAFEDDYSFGILQSSVHWTWFSARCSSLGRTFRYTNDTVFDSFAWPQSASTKDIDRVATCARALREIRAHALDGAEGGLRALYRNLEQLPGKNPLRDAHEELDAAVLKAYQLKPSDGILAKLIELNHSIADDPDAVGPGVPPGYPRPADLVSKDCVAPSLQPPRQKRRSR